VQVVLAQKVTDEICAHLGYYAALSGSSVQTFRDYISVPSSRVKKILENGTDRLFPNIGTELPHNAVLGLGRWDR
jgi:hypothetical protein